MCDNHKSKSEKIRNGEALGHGKAHAADHARWTRRDFLFRVGAASLGGAFMMNGMPVRAYAESQLLNELQRIETDRVLVLIQCSGGNDGLNTVIPITNDFYYNARPQIGISPNDVLKLSTEVGLHPSFENAIPLFQEGKMGILRNVGYPEPNLSHFRSTDIWLTGSDATDYLNDGWIGRTLSNQNPDFEINKPNFPLAVQVGEVSSLLFQSPIGDMGIAITDVDFFYNIVNGGSIYDISNLPNTPYGAELEFVRTVANDSFSYASALQEASESGENEVAYPNTGLGSKLSIVAQMIKGRLGAKIYTVSLGSFDTHSNQLNRQSNLLRELSDAVTAFQNDLAMSQQAEEVLTMTFSEFGRRVAQNASQGTDHGTAAPLFLFGGGIEGGLKGNAPDLAPQALDATGNIQYDMDFRAVYATVLTDWFGLKPEVVSEILGNSFEGLGFVKHPLVGNDPVPIPQTTSLAQNYPNPFNPTTMISFTLEKPMNVRLQVFDISGRLVKTLFDEPEVAGTHHIPFDGTYLPSGMYLYRLETPEGSFSKKMMLVK